MTFEVILHSIKKYVSSQCQYHRNLYQNLKNIINECARKEKTLEFLGDIEELAFLKIQCI